MKKTYLILLGLIIIISLFFRTYQLIGRFGFDHDGDLSSWIVKDITANHHLRLIGQLTSAPGIFIGPLYYYLLIPFYLISNMDPMGGAILVTVIGILTTISYYLVFGKLFNSKMGIIAGFLQASLLSSVGFDRLAVPSTLSNLWVIWYFYTIIKIGRGDFSVLPILGILTGLIWHIHIALAPTLIALPIAFLVSGKTPKLKQVLLGLTTLLVTSIPLVLFEARHHFSQTVSLLQNFTQSHGGSVGIPKLIQVSEMISKNINTLFLSPISLPAVAGYLFTLAILFFGVILVVCRIASAKTASSLLAWIVGVVAFFTLSSSLVSEYYLYSVEIIFIAIASLSLYSLLKFSKVTQFLTLAFLAVLLIKNVYYFTATDIYHKGYAERKAVADFITQDAKLKGYPCVGISYITAPGENVGFRYFFYLNNLYLVHPSLSVPVYNIVIPDELSKEEVKKKFGHIGIILPTTTPPKAVYEKSCQTPNTNLTDPMFGYVD